MESGSVTVLGDPATDAAVPVDPYAEAVVPVFRGVSHAYAAGVAVIAAVALVLVAPPGPARASAAGYGLALVALFAISAALHRRRWSDARRHLLRRLDHCSIHLFIAACSTLVAVVLLTGTTRAVVLLAAWLGAAGGIALSVAWIAAPRQLTSAVYALVAGSALVGAPQVADRLPAAPTALLLGGVVVYAAGALVYALRRPNPAPLAFGYHEIFHALVILAATMHYAAFVGWVVPLG